MTYNLEKNTMGVRHPYPYWCRAEKRRPLKIFENDRYQGVKKSVQYFTCTHSLIKTSKSVSIVPKVICFRDTDMFIL